MKKTILTVFALMISLLSFADFSIYDYSDFRTEIGPDDFSDSKIMLQTEFGKAQIINSEALNEIENQNIQCITLVYTTYKEADKFDQDKLNLERIENLCTLIPGIKENDNIGWSYIGIEGYEERGKAQKQFHGFVIEYEAGQLHYSQLPVQKNTINPDLANQIVGDAGTVLSIPEHAFVHLDGSEVLGEVSVQLREAYTPEDIVLGNLCTTTSDGQILESGGMIQVMAYSEGKELKIQEDKSIDIKMPKPEDNANMVRWVGVWENGVLVWKNPDSFDGEAEDSNSIKSESEAWLINWVKVPFGSCQIKKITPWKKGKTLESLDISTTKGDFTIEKDSFNLDYCLERGLTKAQIKFIGSWFEKDFIKKPIRNDFWGYELKVGNDDTPGTEVVRTTTVNSVYNAFAMKGMGWVNCDRLFALPKEEACNLYVECPNDENLDQLSLTLVIPGRRMLLAGSPNTDGTYNFIQQGRNYVPLPRGEEAYLVANGEKEEASFSRIKKLTLGDSESEKIYLQERSGSELIAEIAEFL